MKPLEPLKTRFWLLTILLIGVITLMFMLKQCSSRTASAAQAPHAEGDTIEVAIEIGPSTLTTQGDSITGHYYQIMESLARDHGLNVKYTPFSTAERAYQGLASGRFDIVISDNPVTADMRGHFIYTDPVAVDRQVLIQLCDSTGMPPITSQDQLGGDTVWIAAGSQYRQRIINLSHEIGDTIHIVEHPDYGTEQLVMLTALGEIPRTVINASAAKKLLHHYPWLNSDIAISFNQFQAWAINPNRTDLRDSLNLWLKAADIIEK